MTNMEKLPVICAVITGDIVGSTKLAAKDLPRVRKALEQAVRSFRRNRDGFFKGPEFFRGDSWQVLLGDPSLALNLLLLIQATLIEELNVQTRASIGVGTTTSVGNALAISTGEAFTLSGRAFENIASSERFDGALPDQASQMAPWFVASLRICGGLAGSWTRRQAEAMRLWLTLPNPTHEAIAQGLNPQVTKQSVGNILTSANWHYLYEVMKAFRATNWQLLSAETASFPARQEKQVSGMGGKRKA